MSLLPGPLVDRLLIRFYTGIVNWAVFLQLFNFILSRCKNMTYWRSDVNADINHQHEPDQLRQGRPRKFVNA